MWLKCDLQNGLRDSPFFETLGLGFYELKYWLPSAFILHIWKLIQCVIG